MQVKVKKDYRYKTVVAFGVEFVKSEAREVAEANTDEARRHPALEIVEPIVLVEKKVNDEHKRPRK